MYNVFAKFEQKLTKHIQDMTFSRKSGWLPVGHILSDCETNFKDRYILTCKMYVPNLNEN